MILELHKCLWCIDGASPNPQLPLETQAAEQSKYQVSSLILEPTAGDMTSRYIVKFLEFILMETSRGWEGGPCVCEWVPWNLQLLLLAGWERGDRKKWIENMEVGAKIDIAELDISILYIL